MPAIKLVATINVRKLYAHIIFIYVPKKIYISSTFGDLEDYRENVRETLNFLGKYFTKVRLMEYMMPGASGAGATILQQCLDDVAECDIYVLIIGKRYGSIEPTTRLSFTENEYNYADAHNKIIIPLIADENADKLSQIQTDNEAEYKRFRKAVQDKYQTFVKGFTNADHLSKQLLLALYRFADEKWIVNEDIKYFCDRSMQYYEFMQGKRKNRLNIFTVVGKEDDRADYFSKRMGKYEFGLEKEYIDTPLRSSMFIGNISRYEKHRKILIGHLMEKFLADEEDCPDLTEQCFDYFKGHNINNIFINLYLSKVDTENSILKKTLESFFSELSNGCSLYSLTIYYVITFQFDNTDQVDDRIAEWITNNEAIKKTKASISDIDPLPMVRLIDVKDWMNKYITASDSIGMDKKEKINNFLSDHFKNLDSSQNMNQTFAILSDLIKIINEKQ